VTVSKLVLKKGAVLPPDADVAQIEASGMGSEGMPKEYTDPGATPLTVTVNDGPNDIPVQVKGKGKGK